MVTTVVGVRNLSVEARPAESDRGPTTGDPTPARSVHTTSFVTPEAVLLESRAAGVASRLLAKTIDAIVQLMLLAALGIIAGIAGLGGGGTTAIIIVVVGFFLIFFAYPMTEGPLGGATIGKKALGLRVITLEGGPIRLRHGAIRSLIWLPEVLLPPGGLLPLSVALLSRRSQRIGDLAAGTVVVRVSEADANPTFFPPAFGAEEFSQRFDASRLGPEQYALVREFLLRAHRLTPLARQHIAARMAVGLVRATAVERPAHVAPESYLVACTFAYQHRFGPTAALVAPIAFGKVALKSSNGPEIRR